jgi:hypothetical protein
MAIYIDTVELPDLVFVDAFGEPPVAAVVEQSIINTPIVFEAESSAGRRRDLMGGMDWGWITKSVLDDLFALASVAGATYVLSYEGVSYTVRFRLEELPVLSAESIVPRPNAADADYYRNVLIKLMEV